MNADEFFLRHDLLHYAVETVLNLKSAFYGMISAGIAITDFDLPRDKRDIRLSDESLFAEHIVNLIMVETKDGLFDDFNNKLTESIMTSKQNLGNIYLDIHKHQSIHSVYEHLLQQWNNLSKDEMLTLEFQE